MRVISLICSAIAIMFCVASFVVVKKRDNNEKIIRKLREEIIKIRERQINTRELQFRRHIRWGDKEIDAKIEMAEEERECENEALNNVCTYLDEVIDYLNNPENYISKKQILNYQRKLIEKEKRKC